MLEATLPNFIAEDGLSQLDSAITVLTQQKIILSSFSLAIRGLEKGLTNRGKRFRRRTCFTTMTTSVSHSWDDEIDHRRRALESLGKRSKYLCYISLTPEQIRDLTEEAFDALIKGTPEFIAGNPSRYDLIERAIEGDRMEGDDDEDDDEEEEGSFRFVEFAQPNEPTRKRRKPALSRTHSPRRPAPPRPSPIPPTTTTMAEGILLDRQDQVYTGQPDPPEPDLQPNSLPALPDFFNDPAWFARGVMLDISVPAESNFQQSIQGLPSDDPLWESRGIDPEVGQWWLGLT